MPGPGGRGASTLTMAQELAYCGQDNNIRTGPAGSAGGAMTGGAGAVASAMTSGGKGGDAGRPGTAAVPCVGITGPGGPAGYAIKRGAHTVTGISDGTYGTGAGPIRGPVGP